MALLLVYQIAVSAQTIGAIAETVVDQNGSVLSNATVTVKGEGGQEFTTTNENRTHRIPAILNGLYTVTVTTNGFKTYVATQVKVDVGLPTTIDAALEIGSVEQTIEETNGGKVLLTQTATVARRLPKRRLPRATRSIWSDCCPAWRASARRAARRSTAC